MRKISLFLAIIMLLSLMLFACDKEEENIENTSASSSEEETSTDQENSSTPSGTIAERALLALLEKDNITLNIKLKGDGLVSGVQNRTDTSIDAYIQKTDGKYQLKFDIKGQSVPSIDIEDIAASEDGRISTELILIDGKLYAINKLDGKYELTKEAELGFELDVEGGIDKLFELYGEEIKSLIGIEIKSSADLAKLLNTVITTLTFNGKIEPAENGGYSLSFSSEHAPYLNSLAKILVDCEDKTLGELLESLFAFFDINMDEQSFILLLEKSLTNDLSLNELIANIESALKQVTGKEIAIKALIDKIQTNSGYSTEQIVEILKNNITSSKIKSQLNAPKEGESIYDYFVRKFGSLIVDSFFKSALGADSMTSVKNALISLLKETTLKELLSDIAGDSASPESIDAIFDALEKYSIKQCSEEIKLTLDKDFNITHIELGVVFVINDGEAVFQKIDYSFTVDFDYSELKAPISAPSNINN
ncbi:MAG: hypothetical protein IJZ93_00075 [Clostridia bacterium]|nr:hypothetical protein [Clostridia bacterium]